MLPHVPIAAVGPAIPAFAIVAFLLYVDVGLGLFGVYRSGVGGVARSVGGLGLALVAAALAIASVFLPAFAAEERNEIFENTLIEKETGWLILACGVGIAGAALHAFIRKTASWMVLLLGLVVYGAAVYQARADQPTGGTDNFFGFLNLIQSASPGVGLYAAGAAGLLAIYAGLIIGSPNLWVARRRALPRR